MSDPGHSSEEVFEDEDNNPFLYQGIASRMAQSSLDAEADNKDKDSTNNPSNAPTEANVGANEGDDDEEDSMLLYNAASASTRKDGFNAIPINFESRITKLLKPLSKVYIQISEAGNSSEGMNNTLKKYVVYTIKLINEADPLEEILTRRRYSEFESLREVLTRIFPLIIIPPIPPKNYMNLNVFNGLVSPPTQPSINHAYINSTHLNKTKLVEHRKRLLTNFLNNCLEIPQIRNLEFFSKFLDPNSNWVDEIALISSQLPKSIYLLNPENGLKTDPLYAHLPVPTSSHTMSFFKDNRKRLSKKTNQLLSSGADEPADEPAAEAENGNHSDHGTSYIINTSSLDEINKKIMENYVGLSSDYTELGTVLNSFSLVLVESNGDKTKALEDDTKLGVLLDKIGQSFDRLFITINALVGDLETKFSEPLGEAVQYSSILQFISRYLSKKDRQSHMLDSELEEKRKDLQNLLNAEDESLRIEGVTNAQPIAKNGNYDFQSANALSGPRSSSKFKLPSFKKITQYVSDIIDQNPEETRKQKIQHLQTKIATLEKCQTIMILDISYIADEVHKNFSAFQAKLLRMIYEILLCYNRFLIGWAKKNIDIWEEVKEELLKL